MDNEKQNCRLTVIIGIVVPADDEEGAHNGIQKKQHGHPHPSFVLPEEGTCVVLGPADCGLQPA